MNETNPLETWQIDAGGQIYETNFDEMTQWISEGSLLPQDKVRRGNLRWIEAQKVPALHKFFNAKENEQPLPIHTSMASGISIEMKLQERTENFSMQNRQKLVLNDSSDNQYQEFSNFTNSLEQVNISKNYSLPTDEKQTQHQTQSPQIPEFCGLHEDAPTAYFCETCANAFCKICPKSYGGNVKICPFCGAMCKSVGKVREDFQRNLQNQKAFGENFGFADFGRALAHPFKYKTSLFLGAAMFMFFSVGQSAAGIGGILMLFAALVCFMLANTLTFGILSNTINNFSQGKLDTNFMPNFDDFSIWDDVVHPFFLSIGAYLSSFAPFILVCIVGFYLIFSSIATQTKVIQEQIEKIPGTNTFDTNRAVQQSDEVKKLLENVRGQNANRIIQQEQISQVTSPAIPAIVDSENEVMQMEKLIQESRKQQLESVAGQMPETEQEQMTQIFRGILGLAAPLVVVGFLALLWGIFYFPAACAVAGYTRSFFATINPLVGLETIKLLGFDYLKIFVMYILIGVLSIVMVGFFVIILSPLDLPKLGNIPAKIISSFFTFYFSIVFACILGYAIFKNADKLKIYRG